ncbi:lytic murein transglycosylase [Puniceibacterium sp. IMCC21224]|uniref:lytic murein transglycosylase n=1 Tax=Puniceibacterium sp. IMCC21224 TaxID=1618204 RepID=UPI00064D9014|nr:lytic murein transglycosylase [Puniceibacterium sp. IMCC21224]KMK67119.1 lytic murein transglycosylase [Puniceibacterium sp. IMCC21224]
MQVTRRWIALAGTAALLSGCGGGSGPATVSAARPDPGLRPQPNAGYDAWVAAFRGRAQAQGVSPATLNAAFRNAGYLPGVVERDRNQTEFSRTLEDYLAIVASPDKVATGRQKFRQHAGLLSEIEGRHGVPANVVAAVWGMESNYGARRGDIPVISAVSTLAYDGRRGVFFEKQLIAALRILERGDVSATNLVGSWAGAMGHTQFIPTTFEAYAVDFRGDGRRDIWSEDPTDGLASTAAYLGASGWRRGMPWGQEVRLPSGFDAGLAGRGRRRAVSEWSALGVRAVSGGAVPDHGAAALLLPMGLTGPAFLAFLNFDVILRYNNSENYGIGVGYLSDRIAGAGPLSASFPPDRNGLTMDDRQMLQQRLTAHGFDTGGSDGVIGPKSEEAIRAYQASVGLPATGQPSRELLRRLG